MSSLFVKLCRSELKISIILSLLRSEKRLNALKEELGSSGSTILHAIKDLESDNLILKSDKIYKLTSLGLMLTLLLDEVSSAVDVLDKFNDLWLNHNVSVIPNHLLQRIGALRDASIIQNNSVELNRVHSTFQRILLSSKKVHGVSPIFHSDYIEVFQRLLGEGAFVELIVTKDVLSRTLSLADPEQITRYVVDEKLKIFLSDNLNVALTVTENSFSMGLFTIDGKYDYSRDLVSNNPKAIEWGEMLFQYYFKDAKSLDIIKLDSFYASSKI
jgi:predicted transcriptional regulator